MAEMTRVWPTIAYEAIAVSATAVGLTATIYTRHAKRAKCVLEGTTAKGIRYRTDGTDPTTNVGMLVLPVVDTGAEFYIEGIRDLDRFKAVRDGDTDCTLHVHYYGDE